MTIRASKFNFVFGSVVIVLGVVGMAVPLQLYNVLNNINPLIGLQPLALDGIDTAFSKLTFALVSVVGIMYVVGSFLALNNGDQSFAATSIVSRGVLCLVFAVLIVTKQISSGYGIFIIQDFSTAFVTAILYALDQEKKIKFD